MRKNIVVRLVLAFVVVGGLVLADFQPAGACSCVMPGPPNEAFARANAVFRGEVRSISSGSGGLWRILSIFGLHGQSADRQIFVAVTDSWKGVDTTEVVIRTGYGGGDCGYPFRVGATYLIYGYENNGRLLANICSRTVAVSAASAVDDFTYLTGKSTLALKPAIGSDGLLLGLVGIAGLVVIGLAVVLFFRRKKEVQPD